MQLNTALLPIDYATAFLYGLGFFSLGLVSWASRPYGTTSSPLARGRGALTAFAITHGVAEWAGVFGQIDSWPLIRPLALALHSLSYVFLFRFSRRIGDWASLPKVLGALPWVLFLAWGSFSLLGGDVLEDLSRADRMGRLLLSFPASALSALALLRYAGRLPPTEGRATRRAVRCLGCVFALYSVASGLILDAEAFRATFGFPAALLRSACAVVAALLYGYVSHSVYVSDLDRYQETLRATARSEERLRVSDELHDTVIQELFALGLELEGHGRSAPMNGTSRVCASAVQRLNQVIERIRLFLGQAEETMRALDFLPQLRTLLDAEAKRSGIDIALKADVWEGALRELPDAAIYQLFRIVEEAVRNVILHSRPDRLSLGMKSRRGRGIVELVGEGRRSGSSAPMAFETGTESRKGGGYGLRSMRHRAKGMGGELKLSIAGGRTLFKIELPLPDLKSRRSSP